MQNELTPLLRLGKPHAQPAAEILVRAFQNYPLFKYFYPDNSRRNKVNRYICSVSAYFGIRFGEVYASSPNLEGVAVWVHSAHYTMGLWNILRAVPLSTLFGTSMLGALRMRATGEYTDHVHKRLAPFDHWYLLLLGVDPQFQGRGYASKLVRPMLRKADQEKLPCYLETNDEADVAIYRHFGFKVIEEGAIPNTTIKNWAMLREADRSTG
jgi:ribosomal protein S18 acetylase RimI-like enzyme